MEICKNVNRLFQPYESGSLNHFSRVIELNANDSNDIEFYNFIIYFKQNPIWSAIIYLQYF